MPVFTPHGPVHEETEFWYDTKEKALLYEVKIVPNYGGAEADHSRTRERGHFRDRPNTYHWHYEPHGILFADTVIGKSRMSANIANTELAVRLWCQMESGQQPVKTGFLEPLIPVPKSLALFLVAKQAEMYKDESLDQTLILLQTYIFSKGNLQLMLE